MPKEKDKDDSDKVGGVLGGLFSGLTELIERLGELAEKGEELSKSGTLHSDEKKGVKGVYGFSVKVGLGGEGQKVEPFGNIRRDRQTGRPVVHEVREPMTDIFEEEDYVLIVAEMPGVDAGDVKADIKQDILSFSAECEDRKYSKEVLLPAECLAESLRISVKNGIVEIKCTRL